jgi:hypothetical protein
MWREFVSVTWGEGMAALLTIAILAFLARV